jgi:enoyl-CoA hydratase
MGSSVSYQNIIVNKEGPIAIIRLNRPKVLNALSVALMEELADAFEKLDKDETISVLILTGGESVFATGMDLKEIAEASHIDLAFSKRFGLWDRLRKTGKPIIAAVSGYCLGGGNELAMCCDIIIAADTAIFGQPEVNIGLMPGAGATQRLARIAGKFRAMELILTGGLISVEEAYRIGLVNKVSPVEALMGEAKKIAAIIASKPTTAVRAAKEAVLKAEDTTMQIGLEFERNRFYTLLSTEDGREGLKAFLEKRPPVFKGR